ncbi:AraC family transcriptional regulator [Xanthomarina sp. F1114]|uniref:helix-turn-helix domain-containing protein n=1 Tax=Xanthomarina sp. F1114 TaxID=2996019 RepID=UPI00225E66DB|nr:AraC family transcriptional regulator [Xanthomarina sp. F1114]MCX7547226.1 AraC family transcriptional regulator [Xanthomarina sp. F1114]
MKTTHLKSSSIKAMLEQLQANFGGNLLKDLKEYTLEINNEIGKGKIKGMTLKGGISYLEFDMVFYHNLKLSINIKDKNPIYFTYCSKGSITHSFGLNEEKRTLESYQTGILTCNKNNEHVLYFTKDKQLKTTLITVQTANRGNIPGNDGLKDKLKETFYSKDSSENYVYIGSHNLQIAEKIEQLNAISQRGVVRSLLIQGLVHVILALEIQQHADDLKNPQQDTGSLTKNEIETIQEVSRYINKDFDNQITINQLYRQFGLSPSKLQEGFKLMHGHTVTEYIREVRIKKAEELIKNTDMNISEVVYSIGLTSRSYFSKIFKEKYNCSPKDYKFAQGSVAISA